MIAEHDTNGDGVLSFQEFKQIFFDGKEIDEWCKDTWLITFEFEYDFNTPFGWEIFE